MIKITINFHPGVMKMIKELMDLYHEKNMDLFLNILIVDCYLQNIGIGDTLDEERKNQN